MPIYEYVCEGCDRHQDVMQKINDPAPDRCDACGAEGRMVRVVSRTSFVLKGGGWYSDLYSSPKPKTEGGSSSSGSTSTTSSASSSAAA